MSGSMPPVVSPAEWQAARDVLLVREKAATRALDALAAERRRLPMVAFSTEHELEGPEGRVGVLDLFAECGVTTGFGLSVFLRDGNRVFRTYFTSSRGVDRLRLDFNLLDLTPLGRQEEWEDSPPGWPQGPAYTWWRLHDEYPDEPGVNE